MSPVLHLRDLAFLLLVLVGPLPLCAALATRRHAAIMHCALLFLFAWFAWQTALALLLGLFHHLTLTGILISEAALFVIGLFVFLRMPRKAPEPSLLPFSEGFLLAGLGALAAALLWVLSAYPTNEWDSLAYHLPAMVQWYQHGDLARLPHDAMQTACYPYGWELLCALFLFPFRSDFLAMLPNLFAWALLGLAVFQLALELGATRLAAAACTVTLLALPGVVENVNTMHVDLALAAFITTSIYFVIRYSRTRLSADACFALVALALACGTKTSALLYIVPIIAALILLPRWRRAEEQERGRTASVSLLLTTIGLWLVTGFWYLRNWIELGNPLAPVTVRLGATVLFPGTMEPGLLRSRTLFFMFQVTDWQDWRLLAKAIFICGGLPFFVLIGASLLALVKRNRRIIFAQLWVIITALLYALTPQTGDSGAHQGQMVADYVGAQMRTGFPFLAAVAVLAALGLSAVRIPAVLLVTGALSSVFLALADLHLLLIIIHIAMAWGAYQLGRRVLHQRFLSIAVPFIIILLIAGSYAARVKRVSHTEAIYGPLVSYLAAQVPAESKIGYLLCAQSYLLYGPHLERSVYYLPLITHDIAAWQSLLHEQQISYVAIGPDKGTFQDSDRRLVTWLHSPNGPLVEIYAPGPDRPILYRVKPLQEQHSNGVS